MNIFSSIRIIELTLPIVLSYISSKYISNKKLNNNYKLNKKNKYNTKIEIQLPPEITYKYTKLNKNNNNIKYHKLITEFINTLHRNINKNDLALLHKNLPTLIIKYETKDIKNNKNSFTSEIATYDIENNIIIIDEQYQESFYHELFHLASSYYNKDNNYTYSGFYQNNGYNTIGLALTEGYTQHLTEKYLNSKSPFYPYELEKLISESIEIIVGEQKMTHLYLTANLKGLIEELLKYNTINNVYTFIYNLDYVSKYYCNKNISKYSINIIINKIKSINEFLIESYLNKITYTNQTSKTKEQTNKFLSLLRKEIIINNNKYDLETLDTLEFLIKKQEKKLIKKN